MKIGKVWLHVNKALPNSGQHSLSTEQTEERAWSVTSRCQGSNAKCPNWDDSMGWLSKEDWQHIPHIPAAYVVSQYWNKGLKVVGGQQLVSPILPLPLPPPPLPPPHLPTLSRRHQRKAGFLLPTWNWKLVLTKHNNSGPHNKLRVSVKIGTRVFPFSSFNLSSSLLRSYTNGQPVWGEDPGLRLPLTLRETVVLFPGRTEGRLANWEATEGTQMENIVLARELNLVVWRLKPPCKICQYYFVCNM